MSESEQEERKLRTVVCDAHGLRYDPDVQEGCVRCLKEKQGPEKYPSDGFDKRIPITLGAVVLMALLLFLGGDQDTPTVAGLDEETAAETETAVQVETEPKDLDPSPVGLQIKDELRQDKERAVKEMAEDLEDTLDDVENFIGDNEWDVMQIAEVGEVVTPEDQIVVSHWTEFVREWNDELNDAIRDYPTQPPADLNFNLTMAYQELGNAVSELRSLPVSGGSAPTTPMWTREAKVQKARSHVDAAREYLEKIDQ
ncbi:MAG: hypothetical protein JRC77_10395 [Deltaproteobacteria bacterium]|nr:hypothetical protein [Deltaproteobacteria bacterium]